MKRRILSWALVLCMVLALLPGTALAVDVVDSGTSDDVTWTLDSEGTLTISGKGEMHNYHPNTFNFAPWYESGLTSSIKSVIITNGVTNIGDYAFWKCTSLTSVTIPDSVTSIGYDAFYDTAYYNDESNWTNNILYIGNHLIEAKQSIASCEINVGTRTIGGGAFFECTSLTSVTIPDSVTSIGDSAFDQCTSLTSVTIPDSVTSIGYHAFYECTSLTSVTIPDSVTSIDYGAFYECSNLKDVYYGGTEEQWKAIAIEYDNYPLFNATIHFTDPPVHEHDYTTTVTAPTCTEQGYTTHTCACGDSYVDTYVDALGHAWDGGVVTTEPTETTDGVKTYTCTHCGETRTEAIPATGVEVDPEVDPTTLFTDVTHNWAYEGIAYCYNHGLMAGMTDTTFAPDGTLTRGQLVAILWRQAGEPKATKACAFNDLTMNYYREAIAWAAENGIVAGRNATHFDPDSPISRQDTAAILYRYAKDYLRLEMSAGADISGFPDYSSVSSYAKDAMAWANAAGIIKGNLVGDINYLDPQGNATRAQAARILMVFCEDIAE